MNCRNCESPPDIAALERQAASFFARYRVKEADADTIAARLDHCRSCPDLTAGGTTCRHCGCLVAVRTRISAKSCPAPDPKWK